jgi:hypothetical protein
MFVHSPLSWCLLLWGCAPLGRHVEVALDEEIATRVWVEIELDRAASCWVEFGSEELGERVTPLSEGESHRIALLGLPPFHEVDFVVRCERDGAERSAAGVVTTGGIPAGLPELEVTVDEPSLQSDTPWFVGAAFGQSPMLFAIDRQGRYLWYEPIPEDEMPLELELERDGAGLVFNSFAADYTLDLAHIQRLDFEGRAEWQQRTELGHHAFTQLPDGALAWLVVDARFAPHPEKPVEVEVVGDAIHVLDAEGVERAVFSTWDWLEPMVSEDWDSEFYEDAADWTHGNALRWNDQRGTLLLSLRNLDTVVELALDTERWEATPVRQYGGGPGASMVGPEAAYQVPQGQVGIDFAHDPSWTREGELLAMVRGPEETLVVRWRSDDEERTLEQTWLYGDDEGMQTQFLGTARDLPGGHILATYASSGIVREITPEGELAWELGCEAGCLFGNVLGLDDFYAP